MTAVRAQTRRWTFADYLTWPDDERWELIDGVAFSLSVAMAPAPVVAHQVVALRIATHLEAALKGTPCRPFVAPLDVRLTESDVVQPDVFVVCDPAKITTQRIEGAPNLVVEVLSPSTATRDLREKKALYERAGVPEYVVVDPLEQYAIHFSLTDGGYGAGDPVGGRESLELALAPGLTIPLWEIFDLPAPGVVTTTPGPSAG